MSPRGSSGGPGPPPEDRRDEDSDDDLRRAYTATHLAIGDPDAAPPPPRSRASSLTFRISAVLLLAMGLAAALHHHTISGHRQEQLRLRMEGALRFTVSRLARRLGLGDPDLLEWPTQGLHAPGVPAPWAHRPRRLDRRPPWMDRPAPPSREDGPWSPPPEGWRPPPRPRHPPRPGAGRPGPPPPPGPGRPPISFVVFDLSGAIIFQPGPDAWKGAPPEEALPHLDHDHAVWIHRTPEAGAAYARFGAGGDALVLGVRHAIVDPEPTAPFRAYLQGSFLAILAATFLAVLAVRMLTRRLEELERGVARVAQGDLAVRLDPGPLDEIGTLIRNFNEMTRALSIAQDELASQDAARRELLADVSHELRTPLTGLLCQLEGLAERSGELPRPLVTDLEAALSEAEAVRQRVEDLLLLARSDVDELPLRPEPTNLQRQVQRLVEGLRPTLEARGITLTTELPGEILEVEVDPDRLGQVVRNLVSNAAQALERGGRITVRVLPSGTGAALEVEDDGPGIPLDEQATIFDRFQRGGGRRGAGTGLGLAIVKRLVERHGGRVSLRSTPGEGATFRVELPGAFRGRGA